MNNLRLYRMPDKYIRYLKNVDSHVQDNKSRRRPYVGVVLFIGDLQYFVPLESPKPNHPNIKPGIHIMKLQDGQLGLLGFNNMIPVPESVAISFDIADEPDQKYAELLKRQVSYINRHKADVMDHASRTYYAVVNKTNKFLLTISCDFKKLESVCKRYDPDYKRRRF